MVRRWLAREDPKKSVARTPKRWVYRIAHTGGWPHGKAIDMAKNLQRLAVKLPLAAKPPPKRKGAKKRGPKGHDWPRVRTATFS
jgi:hypothetical protein